MPFDVKIVADPQIVYRGDRVLLAASVLGPQIEGYYPTGVYSDLYSDYVWSIIGPPGYTVPAIEVRTPQAELPTEQIVTGIYTISVKAQRVEGTSLPDVLRNLPTDQQLPEEVKGTTTVTVRTPVDRLLHQKVFDEGFAITARDVVPTADQGLWVKMRQCLEGRRFQEYAIFIDQILCGEGREPNYKDLGVIRRNPCVYRHGVNGYQLLKAATEVYLLCHACCGELGEIDAAGFDSDA
jgi:hypothetical protein